MSKDLGDFYKEIGFYRGTGLSESQAHCCAEESMTKEVPMGINEFHLMNMLTEALESYAEEAGTDIKTRTYEEAGLLTRDTGLVVDVNGTAFQLTIVKA